MPKVVNFHETVERDLSRLSAEIKSQREKPEVKELPDREVVKRSLEVIKESVEENTKREEDSPSGNGKRKDAGDEDRSSILPAYLEKMPEPQVQLEVEKLVDAVFHHGIKKALKESKRFPPFVQDAFHDSLVDRLLPELKKRGMIPS